MAELRFGGGLNQLDDERINPFECIEGENYLLCSDSGQFKPRPPFDLKGTATNAAEIRGIMQLVKRDNTETTLVQAEEVVYEWDGSTSWVVETPSSAANVTATSLLRASYWSLDDLLIITDLSLTSNVWQWDGTSMTEMTHAIAGVTSLYAKYSIVFQGRVWLFNVTTDASANPHMVLASEFENYDNYDNSVTPAAASLTYSAPFFLLTPDLKEINGVATFFDTIVISTVSGKVFKIIGTDATNYAVSEFYPGSSALGQESMVNIGNDVLWMRRGGKVERLKATEQFGDTSIDDISRVIPNEVADSTGVISVYDERYQRVYLFGSNKILVIDKYALEKQELSPWMKWTTQMSSNLDTKAATFLKRPGTEDYSVYFGGPNGEIYDINGTGGGDASMTLIRVYRKTPLVSQLDTMNDFIEGRISYRRINELDFNLEFEWTDEYADTLSVVKLKDAVISAGTIFWGSGTAPAYWGGDYYWNTAGLAEERVSTAGFSAVGKGPSFFLTTTVNSAVDWEITKLETDDF